MAAIGTNKRKRLLFTATIIVGAWLAGQAGIDVSALLSGNGETDSKPAMVETPRAGGDRPAGRDEDLVARAIANRESGMMVTVEARVVKLLPDDLKGSRHQRFLIELGSGATLLVAHNIDLADRIGLREGSSVRVRGQYEWNERGGVLHWTHHDPDGRHPGGWIESGGERVE